MDRLDSELIFNKVYDEYCRAVHAYFVGRAGDPDAALDLLQETFLRVWRHLDTLRGLPSDRQRYWIFTVAKHALADHYRKLATRAGAYQEYVRNAERFASPIDESGHALEAREELERLDRAIQALPEELRTVLLMQTLGEMSSPQIGEALGRPAGTVRYQIALARRQLAREVQLIEGDDDDNDDDNDYDNDERHVRL